MYLPSEMAWLADWLTVLTCLCRVFSILADLYSFALLWVLPESLFTLATAPKSKVV